MASRIPRDLSDEEDRAIVENANADPDAREATDSELSKMRRGRGPQKKPRKVPMTIRLDPDLSEQLRSHGKGWQSRVNDILRKAEGLD